MKGNAIRIFAPWLLPVAVAASLHADDWPTYRADAARSGYTRETLPRELALRWTFDGPQPRPAWPVSKRMTFDRVNHVVAVGDTVVMGSSADDRVLALAADTGQPRWQFVCDGPVRFAPAAWRERLFVASDDGWLYALSLADGHLLWKQRGGPQDAMYLGNERLVSRWPARGGPVVVGDVVYFAAGIWPTDGVYLHAVDAASGAVLWTNADTGTIRMGQPHGGATANSGVAPQGYLAADDQRLYVPTGRAVPAVFRRENGELLYYHLQQNHTIGGTRVLLADRYFFNGGFLFDRATGALAARCGKGVISVSAAGLVQARDNQAAAYVWKDVETRDRKGQAVTFRGLERAAEAAFADPVADEALQRALEMPRLKDVYETAMRFQPVETYAGPASINQYLAQNRPELARIGVASVGLEPTTDEAYCELIVAGEEPVYGVDGSVGILDLENRRLRWSHPVEGRALGLAVSGGRLLVSTDEGRLYCFDASGRAPAIVKAMTAEDAVTPQASSTDFGQAADEILTKSGVREGICVDLGCGAGELSLELARRSSLTIYAVDSDPAAVAAARQKLLAAGLYGRRVTVHQADLAAPAYPKHFANLVVSARALSGGAEPAQEIERRLQRPFGGVVCHGRPGALTVERRGALEDAGSWTHQNADSANTLCSTDATRGPLSVLWYREVDFEVADRHGQAPAPLFHRGYLVTQGVNGLIALDAYNGRTLWMYELRGLLKDYDGVHHDVGVGDTGGTCCLSDDSVYVRFQGSCLRLDLATGRKLAEFALPEPDGVKRAWGYLACQGNVLFGTAANVEHRVSPRYRDIALYTESQLLFALDRITGEVLWTYRPEHSIRHNTISIAGERVYLVDRPLAPQDRIDDPKPEGKHRPRLQPGEHPAGKLLALDAATGRVIWHSEDDVFGTQTAVSEQHRVLLMYYQAVRHQFFRLPSEIGGRMAAWDLDTGKRLWNQPATYTTRPIINGDKIIAEGGTWALKTGQPLPLRIERTYGCGQFSGSTNLVLYRSGTLGYHDLTRDTGTENFGGMRPGCWFNAIPAGGLVLVPDAVSKCACSYQMHAWIALQGQSPD